MSKTVVAIFDNHNSAESAARQIKDKGLKTADISIVAKQGDGRGMNANESGGGSAQHSATDPGKKARNDNISDGVITGGIVGGLAGLLIGAGSMIIPGLGIVAAAGPITGLLSGVVTGGIVGGLIDLGIPENRGKQYESEIKEGRTLFSMRTDEDKIGQIASILKDNRAISIDTY